MILLSENEMIEMSEYHGIVVKESLKDETVIDKLKVIGTKRSINFTLLKISFEEDMLSRMIEFMQKIMKDGKWYAHFYRDDNLVVIFKEKIFHVTPDKSTWKHVIDFGLAKGIPRKQLDMKPSRIEDETY